MTPCSPVRPPTRSLPLAAALGAVLTLALAPLSAQAFSDPSPLTPKERANPASAPRVPGRHHHHRHRRHHHPRVVVARTTTVTRIDSPPPATPR